MKYPCRYCGKNAFVKWTREGTEELVCRWKYMKDDCGYKAPKRIVLGSIDGKAVQKKEGE